MGIHAFLAGGAPQHGRHCEFGDVGADRARGRRDGDDPRGVGGRDAAEPRAADGGGAFGTLATLYPGRIDLGVGRAPGSDQVTAHALRRREREEDFPRQVRELQAYLGAGDRGNSTRGAGQGTNVPVWLLGSSTYSAQVAAAMGLPFAFASHFAPQDMVEAMLLYRRYFQPSQYLSEPYSAVGVPLVAADTDEEARRLATSPYQRFLRMIRGQRLITPPPVDSMEGLWTAEERALVEMRLGAAVVGRPETVAAKLAALLKEVDVDEVILVAATYSGMWTACGRMSCDGGDEKCWRVAHPFGATAEIVR